MGHYGTSVINCALLYAIHGVRHRILRRLKKETFHSVCGMNIKSTNRCVFLLLLSIATELRSQKQRTPTSVKYIVLQFLSSNIIY